MLGGVILREAIVAGTLEKLALRALDPLYGKMQR